MLPDGVPHAVRPSFPVDAPPSMLLDGVSHAVRPSFPVDAPSMLPPPSSCRRTEVPSPPPPPCRRTVFPMLSGQVSQLTPFHAAPPLMPPDGSPQPPPSSMLLDGVSHAVRPSFPADAPSMPPPPHAAGRCFSGVGRFLPGTLFTPYFFLNKFGDSINLS